MKPLSVFDAHVDSLQRQLDLGHDLGTDTPGHLDLVKGHRGGLGSVVFVCWCDPSHIEGMGARERTRQLLGEYHRLLAAHPDQVGFGGCGVQQRQSPRSLGRSPKYALPPSPIQNSWGVNPRVTAWDRPLGGVTSGGGTQGREGSRRRGVASATPLSTASLLAVLAAALAVPLVALQLWWGFHDYEMAREHAERDALAFADATASLALSFARTDAAECARCPAGCTCLTYPWGFPGITTTSTVTRRFLWIFPIAGTEAVTMMVPVKVHCF